MRIKSLDEFNAEFDQDSKIQIGHGSYANIFSIKNIIDNKLYAIKYIVH